MKIKSRYWLLFGLLVILGLALPTLSVRAQDNSVELVGPITAVNGTTITVNERIIDVSSAEVKAALEVGIQVKVEGILLADGTIQAREVKSAEGGIRPDEIEVVGTLEKIWTRFVVVSGLTFDTTSAEVQRGLAVGDLVKVHASLAADGSWVAREVERENLDDSRDDSFDGIELIGTLDQVGSDFIVVAGLTFDTTQAEIKGTLVVGALVKVHGVLSGDGSWAATEVELSIGDDSGHDGEDDSSQHDGSDDDSSDDSMDDSSDDSGDDSSDDSGHDDSHDDDSGHGGDDSGHDSGDDD